MKGRIQGIFFMYSGRKKIFAMNGLKPSHDLIESQVRFSDIYFNPSNYGVTSQDTNLRSKIFFPSSTPRKPETHRDSIQFSRTNPIHLKARKSYPWNVFTFLYIDSMERRIRLVVYPCNCLLSSFEMEILWL
uniref:Uncharacterized protein n=1 Tax=Lepeophtheirus salmonis TaxID=72036 RepID=A0A0K2T3W7_LEPSM